MTSNTLPYAEVIGDPISHSKSPVIHNFWLKKLGIAAAYQARHVTPPELSDYIAMRVGDAHWRGCNVTLPHKIAVLEHVPDPGGVRDSIGAANTIFRDGSGKLVATNTDAAGFFAPISDREWAGSSAVVIGSGGAARAILFALAQADIGEVTVQARSPLKATAMLAHFGLKGRVVAVGSMLPPASLLVNASTLGMTGQDALDLDLSPLPDDAIVFDIVYSPLETALLRQAKQLGVSSRDGLDMLIGQAAIAFELFFGQSPPDECEDELRELLLR